MAATKLNALSLGYAGAILSAIWMLIMGVLGNFSIALSAIEIMKAHHIFFSLSAAGIISGMIEAAIFSFVALFVFGWLYNKFA